MLQYLNSIDPHIKFTIEQPNEEGSIPFLDTFPKPQGGGIAVAVYRKPTHTDRYLDFHSSHPVLAKRAVVRALMDRAGECLFRSWYSSQRDGTPQQGALL